MPHIDTFYPKAQPLSRLWETIQSELEQRDMTPKNCIWGTSFCSDEVNNSFNTLGEHFAGEGPFRFGGISGIPFAGLTGFAAFAGHIPENGGAVILYGPHIGITSDGEAGLINREGQKSSSTCCGSLVAGLESVKAGNVLNISHDDYQQGQVNKMLIENYETIKKADQQILKTTDIAYAEINRRMNQIVEDSRENRKGKPILLIGGIVVNTDWKEEDAFEIRDISFFND